MGHEACGDPVLPAVKFGSAHPQYRKIIARSSGPTDTGRCNHRPASSGLVTCIRTRRKQGLGGLQKVMGDRTECPGLVAAPSVKHVNNSMMWLLPLQRLLEVKPASSARPIELHNWDHKERMRFAGRDQR